MASITVQDKGFYTTVQDLGRFGYASLGVPESGAMDKQALRLSNLLLNNPEQAAALECTLIGPTILFHKELAFVLTGGQSKASLDQQALYINQVYVAQKGQVLRVGKVTKGSRVYLGLDGGIDSTEYLGSKSLFFPISPQATVTNGMALKTAQPNFGKAKGVHLQSSISPSLDDRKLTVHRGPEFHLLSDGRIKQVLKASFTINSGNRMGIALSPDLEGHTHKMLTGPVMPGTIQLTPRGKLFVLMRDCQPTGGYPRILQCTEEAINCLAQKKTGDRIKIELH